MSASYEITIVPPHTRAIALRAVEEFLASLGFRAASQHTQEQRDRPIDYACNRVVFIGAERGEAWVPVVGWAGELRVDFVTWRRCNPLAASLSAAAGTAVYLWTHNDGVAAGYSIFWQGELRETQLVGELVGMPPSLLPPATRTLLGAAINEPGFVYSEFMRRAKDYEQGTATIASRFGLDVHLADAMDLVDGAGGIRLNSGRFEQADTLGWTGLVYDAANAS